MHKKPIELLAPAGDMERLEMALAYGADAVYLAGTTFGMRSFAGNFSPEELKAAVELCHGKSVRVHVTCNTMPRNEEAARLPEWLEYLDSLGVDAVILADMGVFSLAGKYAPHVERHISTQASVVNYQCARAWYDLGAKRVILARELSLDEIAEKMGAIRDTYGPEALAIISGTGRHHLAQFWRFGNVLGTPNATSSGALICLGPRKNAGDLTAGHFAGVDYYGPVKPAGILVWGANPAVSGADGELQWHIKDAARAGTPLIVVDPQPTELARQARALRGVRLRGLMAIPPMAQRPEDNRPYFAAMRELFVDMRGKMSDNQSDMDCLSMGMSGDFEEAIAQGATLVRVGTALFGPRPPMHP